MTKQKTIELTYDAPLSAVSAMLRDPAFRSDVCDAQRAQARSVEVDGTSVAITYTQRVAGLPGFASKFVGDSIEVEQRETWDADFTRGDLQVALPGKPGRLTGTASLAESGGRTVETVVLTADVSVPLVGGKLEDLVLGIFEKALRKEEQVGARYLAR